MSTTDVGSVFVSNYPPFSFWNEDALARFRDALGRPPAGDTALGLYLHIPFCRRRCKFCYFKVYTDKNAGQIEGYLDALAREVELYAEQPAIAGRRLDFVYFGGGTPSYIAVKHLEALVARLDAALPWSSAREIAFECEPGTLTESKVQAIRRLGITRVSLGVEHFDDRILAENGRAHVSTEIYRCLPWIREAGFDQLNLDLIAGMVGDTWETWRDAVQRTIDVDPDSVTIYQMELPYNTIYSQGVLGGGASPVADWETKRAWNDYAIEQLCAAGYEISSAYTLLKPRPGKPKPQFLYRDALWEGADMLGTGVASFGHLSGVHVQNHPSWNDYLAAVGEGRLPVGRAFATDERERLTRELILQMKRGALDLEYFRDKFEVDPLDLFDDAFERLRERRMLEVDEDRERVRLSREGLLQVDALLPEFYAERYRGARYT